MPDALYDRIIEAIKADPEAVIREERCDQLKSLKLLIPDKILATRKARRKHHEFFETIIEEMKRIEVDTELAIKQELDNITNKPKFHNKELRQSEYLSRIEIDGRYTQLNRHKRNTWATIKSYDEDLDYLERLDQSLIEILAMTTAQIEFETRYSSTSQEKSNARNLRTSARAKRRAAQLVDRDREEIAGTAP